MKHLKKSASDILFDVAGSILFSAGLYSFAKPAAFAPGGVSGLSLILSNFIPVPIGTISLLLNIPLVLISLRFVGKDFLLRTLRSTLICTFFLDVIFPRLPVYSGDRLLAALFSGLLVGTGLTLFYIRGSSSGGTDLITMSVKSAKPHLSIGTVTLSVDVLIILSGIPVFGDIDSVLYGLISTGSASLIIDRIMCGRGSEKLVIVITSKGHELADRILVECGRGSTLLGAEGSFTGDAKQLILCACHKSEAYRIQRVAQRTDSYAFIMLSDTSEVFGNGFSTRFNKEDKTEDGA